MNNPMEILKIIKQPKQFVMNYLKNNNNPMINNLVKMAENNDVKGLEEFGRNFYRERGKDFDKEFDDFKDMFK